MAIVVTVTDDQRVELVRLSRAMNEPARKVRQAKVILALSGGASIRSTARKFEMTAVTVTDWRNIFLSKGVAGLGVIGAGRGRKPLIDQAVIEAIVNDTLTTVPEDGSSCWTTRTLAERHNVGKDTVARLWKQRRLQPWKVDTFKLSTDPDFEHKLVDIVGLYMDPPDHAAVFCFDEKTQIQALDRTQPSLPMTKGRAQTMTHDYKRNGVIDLFAALNVGTGEVLHDTRKTHTGKDILAFFKSIDTHVPTGTDIHVVLDNLSAHKSEPVREWLALPEQARWHLHFTPTSTSWLNLVECWFSVLTRKRLTNTAFKSVKHLTETLNTWIKHWNTNPTPFIWQKTAEEILASVHRARTTLQNATPKSATDH